MPPTVAAVACLLFIAYLFWDDVRKRKGEGISWVPFAWMFIAGSRFASSWLHLGGPMTAATTYEEGSPTDRAVFLSLILWGLFVLARRKINWSRILTENKWIAFYLVYCLLSLLWSDEPFVLAKRWIKDLGNPIVVLVLLTERQPYEAVGITLRRLSFLLLPLSVLFIKYYPEMGRAYLADGSVMWTGVGHQKNDLGLLCLITGMYFAWAHVHPRPGGKVFAGRSDAIDAVLIGMLGWLLYMSNSQTSIACLVVAIGVLVVAKLRSVSLKPSRVVSLITIAALGYLFLQSTFGVNNYIFRLMGRDPTLTNRTTIWRTARGLEVNQLVGAGFLTFWNPERTAAFKSELGASLNQSHNGYLEQYLNLGYVGVAFIIAILVSALLDVRRHLDEDARPALLRLCFLVAAIMYNYTEASFYGINNMWVLLLTASINTKSAISFSSRAQDTPPAPRELVPRPRTTGRL